MQLLVNGESASLGRVPVLFSVCCTVRGGGGGGRENHASGRPASRSGIDGNQIWVRRWRLRSLHGLARRRGEELLHHSGGFGGRASDHHHRRFGEGERYGSTP